MTVMDDILGGLMRRYQERVPDVLGIINAMIEESVIASVAQIENDHIAFRTMGVPQLGLKSLEKIFLHHGYTKMDPYNFTKKKLSAFWYSPPREDLPRIFISELRVDELSVEAQAIIRSYTDTLTEDPVDVLFRSFAAKQEKNFKGLAPFESYSSPTSEAKQPQPGLQLPWYPCPFWPPP